MEIFYLLTYKPPELTQAEVMKRLVNLAKASEDCGFDIVWLLEHHFTDFGLLGNPFVAASHVLGATKKIKVGTAAIVLPNSHPARQIADVNLLDQMSKGRFRFGICRGLYDKDFRVFGTDMNKTREIMNTWYDLISNSMKTGTMQADNEYTKFPEVVINPNPHTKNGAPFYVIAESASTTEWAAERGIPMNLSWIINTSAKVSQIELYNEVAKENGHDLSKINHVLAYITSVNHDSEKAKASCHKFLSHWYDAYNSSFGVQIDYVSG